jgi:predicted RNA-binding Zn ribbon-like protein
MNASLELCGDHVALDLINTVIRANGGLIDTWKDDSDVLAWLLKCGLLPEAVSKKQSAKLLETARRLRETVRKLVLDRKAGLPLDIAPLNHALSHASRHIELVKSGDDICLAPRYATETPDSILAPLAEAAADLLANVDFNLVRKCEDAECVLWFLDRTKAHRRRWCSMAVCGNRNKVALFRQRHR